MFLFASMYSQISLGFSASNAGLYIGIFFGGFVIAAQWGGRMLDQRRRPRPGPARLRGRGRRLLPVGRVDARSRLRRGLEPVVADDDRRRRDRPGPRADHDRRPQPGPDTSYGEVTGITQTARNVGASVGLAILGTLLISQNRSNIEDSFEELGATKAQADASPTRSPSRAAARPPTQIQQAGSKAAGLLPRRPAELRRVHRDDLLRDGDRDGAGLHRRAGEGPDGQGPGGRDPVGVTGRIIGPSGGRANV